MVLFREWPGTKSMACVTTFQNAREALASAGNSSFDSHHSLFSFSVHILLVFSCNCIFQLGSWSSTQSLSHYAHIDLAPILCKWLSLPSLSEQVYVLIAIWLQGKLEYDMNKCMYTLVDSLHVLFIATTATFSLLVRMIQHIRNQHQQWPTWRGLKPDWILAISQSLSSHYTYVCQLLWA